MEQLNRKLIKQRVKETVERSQDYIRKAKKNDRIRIHQAPCFPFKVNGVVREIAVRLKQDGKTVEAILQGMGYQKVIFTFKLSELSPSAFDKAKEATEKVAKKASEALKVATDAHELADHTMKADEEAKKKKATSSSSAPKKRAPRKTTRTAKKAAPETPDKP